MNPQIHLSATKAPRALFVLAVVVCAFAAIHSARAQSSVVVASLIGSNGTPVVNITSNESFTLALIINTNFPAGGLTYFFRSNAAGSGFFAIASRDTTGSPFPLGDILCNGDDCVLNPSNDFDLGGGDPANPVPPGTYTIATYTFTTMGAPLGQYTISTDRGVVDDRTGGGFADVPFNAVAIINVVPEPSATGLALVGGAILLVMIWRRQRAHA